MGLKVGVKNVELLAAKPVTVFNTLIGPKLAPAGTITVKLLTLAAVTIAFVAPKITILLVVIALKLLPVIVTEIPIGPFAGPNEFIIGCADILIKPSIEMYNNKYLKIAGVLYLKLVINTD